MRISRASSSLHLSLSRPPTLDMLHPRIILTRLCSKGDWRSAVRSRPIFQFQFAPFISEMQQESELIHNSMYFVDLFSLLLAREMLQAREREREKPEGGGACKRRCGKSSHHMLTDNFVCASHHLSCNLGAHLRPGLFLEVNNLNHSHSHSFSSILILHPHPNSFVEFYATRYALCFLLPVSGSLFGLALRPRFGGQLFVA